MKEVSESIRDILTSETEAVYILERVVNETETTGGLEFINHIYEFYTSFPSYVSSAGFIEDPDEVCNFADALKKVGSVDDLKMLEKILSTYRRYGFEFSRGSVHEISLSDSDSEELDQELKALDKEYFDCDENDFHLKAESCRLAVAWLKENFK
ncbi:DMP19 family protein [Cerasicoccus maritimus]|uniref:DMP19 family protein n=1 Tax=Cerasicoccus maritimus TaxID=490089 RepID=UPI00285262CB|nr:hypothetical protein [Cerasicoccus maritimus]